MTEPALVELHGVSKRFGATIALDGVDLEVRAGTVHGLVGENGAGKSTLGKMLAGVHQPDAGEILVDGREVSLRTPRQALAHGITAIAQELSLVPARTVLDNVFLGIESAHGGLLDRAEQGRRYEALVSETGLDVPGDAIVRSLPIAAQQRVEILRALARDAKVVVLDEPTARLSAVESEQLHMIVRSIAGRGAAIVFISHFLDEVLQTCDEITILRDGRLIRSSPAPAETATSLIEGMVGRSLESTFPEQQPVAPDAREALRIEGLTRRGVFQDVDLIVRAGEIVALAGLIGSGRSEVARAILGADHADGGRLVVGGAEIVPGSVPRVMAAGVAMIPESRKDQGLLLQRSLRENVSLPHLRRLSRLGFVRRRSERTEVAAEADRVDVRRRSDELPAGALSGGNQQKLLFARSLMGKPKVLLADEPTRGVDVAAKRSIYDILVQLAGEGMGILMISSELEEVLGLAHRVLVMKDGQIVAEFDRADATEHAIMVAAFGATDDGRTGH